MRVKSGSGFGQGVLISDTEVLTAYHVVRGARSVTLILPATAMDAEQQINASVKGYDSDLDIALLTLTPFPRLDIDYATLPFAQSGGCPPGATAANNGDLVVMETTGDDVSSVKIFRIWGRRSIGIGINSPNFKTDIPGTEGMSGSPLYGAEGRTLVGLVIQKDPGLSNITPLIAVDGCRIIFKLADLRAGAME